MRLLTKSARYHEDLYPLRGPHGTFVAGFSQNRPSLQSATMDQRRAQEVILPLLGCRRTLLPSPDQYEQPIDTAGGTRSERYAPEEYEPPIDHSGQFRVWEVFILCLIQPWYKDSIL